MVRYGTKGVGMEGLSSVYWLGGGPCSGKTTASKVVGARAAVLVFHVDERRGESIARADPVRHPRVVETASRLRTEGIQ